MRDEFNHMEIDGREEDNPGSAQNYEPEPKIAKQMSDEEFNGELEELMKEDTSGGKKKKSGKTKGRRKKWSRKKKITAGVVAAVVVVFGVSKVMIGGGKSQIIAMTFPLAKGEVAETLSVSGPVEGTDSVEVVSNLHAEILELPVKEGDHVEKGKQLAALDEKDAKKGVDIAQNAYDLAVTTYNEKQIEAENGYAKANYDRTNVLFQSGSASQLELEKASDALNNALRELKTFTLKDGRPVANESYSLQIQNAAFELGQKRRFWKIPK